MHGDDRLEITGSKFNVSGIGPGQCCAVPHRADFASAPLFARCNHRSPAFPASGDLVLLWSIPGQGFKLGSGRRFDYRRGYLDGLSSGVASNKEAVAKLRQVTLQPLPIVRGIVPNDGTDGCTSACTFLFCRKRAF